MSSELMVSPKSEATTMLDVNRAVADLRRGSFVVIESQGEIVLT